MHQLFEVNHVEKIYGNRGNIQKALDNIRFGVIAGKFVGIMEPSESRKNTLLNCIFAMDGMSAGESITKVALTFPKHSVYTN